MIAILFAATATVSDRPLGDLESRLFRALSAQVARTEQAEARADAAEARATELVAAARRDAERERKARQACEARPAEVPDWVWGVVGVAAGVAGAGVVLVVTR